MNAFAHHLRLDFLAGVRNSTGVLMFYLFPLGFYALMAVIMTEINPVFADTAVPALVVVTLLAGSILGLPGQFVETRQMGIYRTFKVNGVPAWSILASPVISAAGHGVVAATIIALTAGPLFGLAPPTNWFAFYAVTLVSALCFGALAALIGVVSNGSRATVLWSQLVFLPSMLIGGLMVDLSLLPDSVIPFAELLPPTHAGQALVGTAFGGTTVLAPGWSLFLLATSTAIDAALAVMLFDWDQANRTRRYPKALALLAFVPFATGAALL